MYIDGVPTVEFESQNLYCWCAHSRIRLLECISLERSLWNVSPGMYITSVPTVQCESKNVYC